MERVSGDGFFSYRREVKKREARKAGHTGPPRPFSSELRDVAEPAPVAPSPDIEDGITGEMLDAVFEAGDRLKKRGDSVAFTAYRTAVQRFLGAVVRRALNVEEHASGSSILRRKRYTIVQIIDSKLEQLAAGMVSTQREQLDLLARVDEINGMLIDLSH